MENRRDGTMWRHHCFIKQPLFFYLLIFIYLCVSLLSENSSDKTIALVCEFLSDEVLKNNLSF